jgi:hypothetical protein
VKKRNSGLSIIATLLVLGTYGCGGSSNNTSSELRPKLTINWPDLTRSFDAPKVAASAQITLSVPGIATPLTWTVDRPTGTAALSQTYAGPVLSAAGPATLSVAFRPSAGGAGTDVATAQLSVIVNPDGTFSRSDGSAITSIAPNGTLTALLFDTPKDSGFNTGVSGEANIFAGAPIQLNIFAQGTSAGPGSTNLVALSPELIQSRLVTTVIEGNASITAAGRTITGVQEGSARVRVSLDGITGERDVRVLPPLATARTLDIAVNSMQYDASRSAFWGTFGGNANSPNTIALINPATGAITSPYQVGSDPQRLAVSADGTKAYVGVNSSNSVVSVNLANGSTSSLIQLNDGGTAGRVSDVVVNPNNPNEAAVTVQGVNSSANWGPIIIRNDERLPQYIRGSYSDATTLAYTNNNTLVGIQNNTSAFSGGIFSIGDDGCSQVESEQNVGTSFARRRLFVVDNIGYTSDGIIFNATNLSRIANLSTGNQQNLISTDPTAIAVDPTQPLVWYGFAVQRFSANDESSYVVRAYNRTTSRFVEGVFIRNIRGNVRSMHRFGATGLAIQTDNLIHILATAPGL